MCCQYERSRRGASDLNGCVPEDLKAWAVKVDGGSGVLLPALGADYSYVFTAAHNLRPNPEILEEYRTADAIEITLPDGTSCSAIRYEVLEAHDAAILLLPYCDVEPLPVSPATSLLDEVWLAGFPDTRRDGRPDPVRIYRGKIENQTEAQVVISTVSFDEKATVEGSSGGGVYRIAGSDWELVAIEFGMESREREGHNWLRCVPISVFEELIRDKALDPIAPPFLAAFDSLLESMFLVPGFECVNTRAKLRDILKDVARNIIRLNGPTPLGLKEKFKKRLLVFGEPEYRLMEKKLWISWIELLVLSVLLEPTHAVDDDYIERIHKRRRLLYSGSKEEWTGLLEDIMRSDLEGLDPDGIVLISNNRDVPPVKTESIRDLSTILPDIALPVDSLFDIGKYRKRPAPRKLLHIDGVHKNCITEREAAYLGDRQTNEAILAILKEAYHAIFA
jgi:hypothetical protein